MAVELPSATSRNGENLGKNITDGIVASHPRSFQNPPDGTGAGGGIPWEAGGSEWVWHPGSGLSKVPSEKTVEPEEAKSAHGVHNGQYRGGDKGKVLCGAGLEGEKSLPKGRCEASP
jgi:hypothetical protein